MSSFKLNEGESYPFLVEKRIEVPERGACFVVKDPGGMRYLISREMYIDYPIIIGESINCKVDKINCRGEVFLEPINPWFTQDNSYEFTVKDIITRTDEAGDFRKCLVVTDARASEHFVFWNEEKILPEIGSGIKLSVSRISKGVVHLSDSRERDLFEHLQLNSRHSFLILRKGIGIDGKEIYIVEDSRGISHIIPVRYYEHYGLKVGESFLATIEAVNSSGKKIIEPDNPFYNKGDVVEIEVISVEKELVGERYRVIASDKHDFSHDILSSTLVEMGRQVATVIKMRKGRPVLEIIS